MVLDVGEIMVVILSWFGVGSVLVEDDVETIFVEGDVDTVEDSME